MLVAGNFEKVRCPSPLCALCDPACACWSGATGGLEGRGWWRPAASGAGPPPRDGRRLARRSSLSSSSARLRVELGPLRIECAGLARATSVLAATEASTASGRGAEHGRRVELVALATCAESVDTSLLPTKLTPLTTAALVRSILAPARHFRRPAHSLGLPHPRPPLRRLPRSRLGRPHAVRQRLPPSALTPLGPALTPSSSLDPPSRPATSRSASGSTCTG